MLLAVIPANMPIVVESEAVHTPSQTISFSLSNMTDVGGIQRKQLLSPG